MKLPNRPLTMIPPTPSSRSPSSGGKGLSFKDDRVVMVGLRDWEENIDLAALGSHRQAVDEGVVRGVVGPKQKQALGALTIDEIELARQDLARLRHDIKSEQVARHVLPREIRDQTLVVRPGHGQGSDRGLATPTRLGSETSVESVRKTKPVSS